MNINSPSERTHTHKTGVQLCAPSMPILYALVARGTDVLAEFSGTTGNFQQISRRILEKLPTTDARMSYVYDRHVFHYVIHNRLAFLCMADEGFGRRVPFVFLDEVIRRASAAL